MVEILAHHSGRSSETVAADIERDRYMTALEAKEYGLIDEIILPRRGVSAIGAATASSLELAAAAP